MQVIERADDRAARDGRDHADPTEPVELGEAREYANVEKRGAVAAAGQGKSHPSALALRLADRGCRGPRGRGLVSPGEGTSDEALGVGPGDGVGVVLAVFLFESLAENGEICGRFDAVHCGPYEAVEIRAERRERMGA